MSTPIAVQPAPVHRHRLLWLVTVVLALLVGYLLGHRTPICVASGAGARVGDSAAGGSGGVPPSPAGRGSAAVGEGAAPVANAGSSSGDSTMAAPSGPGSEGPGSPSSPAAENGDVDPGSIARRYAASTGGLGPTATDSGSQSANTTTLTATDFSYDATGLPHYPNGVTRVASARTTHLDAPADTGSTAVILTSDSFNDVVAWYHGQVPSTWHQSVIGNMEGLSAQLSPQNLGRLLMALHRDGSLSPNASLDTTGAAGPGVHTSVAVWQAPSDTRVTFAGVMVVTRTGKPTEIILKRRVGT